MSNFAKLSTADRVEFAEVLATLQEYGDERWSISAKDVCALVDKVTPDSTITDQRLIGLARACFVGMINTVNDPDAKEYLDVLRHLVGRFGWERVEELIDL